MASILCGIAAVLLVLMLPYAIAVWKIRHISMRCMRIEPAHAKDVSEPLKGIFKAAIAELKSYNFKVVSCHQLEYGPEQDGWRWGILLQHSAGEIYAGLVSSQLIHSSAPLVLSFMTFFEDETQLTTINTPNFGIYSPSPQEITQYVGAVPLAEQWQAHQQKMAELGQTKQVQTLSLDALLNRLEKSNKAHTERLVKTGEVSWVKPGESYRMTWLTAIRAVYQVARKGQSTTSNQAESPAIGDAAATETPVVDLEIAEFHRLQQKQREGMSRRGKNWLLLGTLALFIASYSSVFEPQRLLIFIAVLLLHEGGHVVAMKIFGYRDTVVLFIPFLGALATARKDNASLTEKVWISLAGPLPGLALGIGLAIAFSISNVADPGAIAWYEGTHWVREMSWMLILLNLFNLLPIYPLDGGQVADLLLFSRNPYVGVVFQGIGVLLLGVLGLSQPLMLIFALLIAILIPSSFRLAKLNARFRKDLRQLPHADRDGLIRFLFTQLQVAPYHSLPFAKKYSLVVGVLSTHREETATWNVRASLISIYLVSLLSGLAGGLYALIPNWITWSTMIGTWINPEGVYRGRIQHELDAANRALQTDPNDEEAYLRRSRARLVMKDYQGAIADANRVMQVNPNLGEAYQLRASARRQLGDLAGATADQEKGIVLVAQQHLEVVNQQLSQNSQDPGTYISRASLYYAMKRYQEALADCNQALLLDPQNMEAVLYRGEVYLALQQYPEALGNADQAVRLDPDSGEGYLFRSRVRHEMGDEAGAIADEQKAGTLVQPQEDEDF